MFREIVGVTLTISSTIFSITRKPIRSKGRQSSLSVYSVTTLSSEDGNQKTPAPAIVEPKEENTQDQVQSVQSNRGESLV